MYIRTVERPYILSATVGTYRRSVGVYVMSFFFIFFFLVHLLFAVTRKNLKDKKRKTGNKIIIYAYMMYNSYSQYVLFERAVERGMYCTWCIPEKYHSSIYIMFFAHFHRIRLFVAENQKQKRARFRAGVNIWRQKKKETTTEAKKSFFVISPSEKPLSNGGILELNAKKKSHTIFKSFELRPKFYYCQFIPGSSPDFYNTIHTIRVPVFYQLLMVNIIYSPNSYSHVLLYF